MTSSSFFGSVSAGVDVGSPAGKREIFILSTTTTSVGGDTTTSLLQYFKMGKGGRSGRIVNDFGPNSSPKGSGPAKRKSETTKDKPAAKTSKREAQTPLEKVVPLKLQQLTLNVFKDTFPDILSSDILQALLQEIKSALFERDFERAFGRKDYLEAYSVRWSPSRALCYQSILVNLQQHLTQLFPLARPVQPITADDIASRSTLRVVSFGGGAAEVVAFGGFLRYLHNISPQQTVLDGDLEIESLSITDNDPEKNTISHKSITRKEPEINLLLIDSAEWQDVSSKLGNGLTTLPTLSKYANASTRNTNSSLVPAGSFSSTSIVENALAMDQSRITDLMGEIPNLITLLFTLNELYTASISKTTTFLLNLTAAARSGTLLLVVDSPGSYSETQVGTEAKKYPMQWLLDHTLLETEISRGQVTPASWEKIVSEDSKWFRIHESLRYPIPLENMRCQLHLYRRI